MEEAEPPDNVASMADDIASIKQDMDKIIPALLDALKRNQYFDELQAQLRRSTKIQDAWTHLPLILGIHDAATTMQEGGDVPAVYVEQLLDLLYRNGVSEFGFPGEVVDPDEIEISAFSGEGPVLKVAEAHRHGLKIEDTVLRKALVTVVREKE